MDIIRKIFSIYNSEDNKHKIIRIFGIKVKIKMLYLTISSELNIFGTHRIYNIFGLKVQKATKLYKKNRKFFEKYKNNNIDITTYPKATRQMRQLQLANLYLLQCLDKICKENNITYWLDFGTLLGAVRHKGFIPWDDDIDVSMMRKDYERIIDLINNNNIDPDIYADYLLYQDNPYKLPMNPGRFFIIKVRHKKSDKLFVDIFPYDFSGYIMDDTEQRELSKLARNCSSIIRKKYNDQTTVEDILVDNTKWRKFLYGAPRVSDNDSDVIWGFDYEHGWAKWAYSHDTIFPLQDISFEGYLFKCANKKEEYLAGLYRNYMSYPSNIMQAHSLYMEFSEEDTKIISEIAQKVMCEVE